MWFPDSLYCCLGLASLTGRFPFTKKFGKFPLGIFIREECVPFVTSPILCRFTQMLIIGIWGCEKTDICILPSFLFTVVETSLGRLKDRERHGTGDKDEKSVNGTQISIGKFPPGKRDYLFRNSVFSGNFPVERTEKSCSIYNSTGISGISGIFW